MSFYAQDSFKVSPQLTLNFGLRWEPTFSDPDKYGRGTSFSLAGFYAGQLSTVYSERARRTVLQGRSGNSRCDVERQKGEFRASRRAGVESARRRPRHACASAARFFTTSAETWFNERETTNAPVGTTLDTPNPVGGLSNPWLGYPGGNPFPQNGKASSRTGGIYINMPINPKPTYVAQWNVTYQRQIGKLDGFGQLSGQQDHPPLEQWRRNQSGDVPGIRPVHDQRR